MNRWKICWKASGSRTRNTRLNVSWLGIPCSNRRNCRNNCSLERPNNAMSVAHFAPHSTAASAMTRTSSNSCTAFGARGSDKLRKILANFCIGPVEIAVDRGGHLILDDLLQGSPAEGTITLAPIQALRLHCLHDVKGHR